MKIAFFGTRPYFKTSFEEENKGVNEITFLTPELDESTVQLAKGYDVVCLFVNDNANAKVVEELSKYGVKLIALRCAGFNNVDLDACEKFNIAVLRVPSYSPNAVAEHAVSMLTCLNRKLHKAYNKVRDGNFDINGLMGFDIVNKTIGVVGTGQIGFLFAKILKLGFGAKVIAYDIIKNAQVEAIGIPYVSLDELLQNADIISLHAPLTPATHHLINTESLKKTKRGVGIINTSRGGLIDSAASIVGLKSGHIGFLGLDVYEEESHIFNEDFSARVVEDDVITRLTTFPNVLITAHQAWFTIEAVTTIARTTLDNVAAFSKGSVNPKNVVKK
eukprot:TRINITY_DN7403_c0_g1_i1.p1 TRINITY_DN7403_c0_g1~~TRINITY_DN7403_c0_g1_i1.p1  ORF type:complete len:332 (-),score=87.55 TRINITY_DN7403_c0_g1_i1:181-1176(-)